MEAALTSAQYSAMCALRQEVPNGKETVLALFHAPFLVVKQTLPLIFVVLLVLVSFLVARVATAKDAKILFVL